MLFSTLDISQYHRCIQQSLAALEHQMDMVDKGRATIFLVLIPAEIVVTSNHKTN